MAENQLCILVVDDHVMTCDGIAALVEKQTSCAVTAAYSSTAALDN
jgi:DNA-binding NarL/FixJ family response regulator